MRVENLHTLAYGSRLKLLVGFLF